MHRVDEVCDPSIEDACERTARCKSKSGEAYLCVKMSLFRKFGETVKKASKRVKKNPVPKVFEKNIEQDIEKDAEKDVEDEEVEEEVEEKEF
jgi:hypothetical protein